MGLGDIHEDLPFGHPTTPQEHLQRLYGVVDATCGKLLGCWAEAVQDDRDFTFPLFALSRMGIYHQEVFEEASVRLSGKLKGLATQGLRQWLLACNSVNHSLASHAAAIACYEPPVPWEREEDSRLHQMVGALAFLPSPNPLLDHVLTEVASRPVAQLQKSKAVALYGLHVVHLLTASGCLPTSVRLPEPLVNELAQALERRSRLVRRCSRLEDVLGQALTGCGYEVQHDVLAAPGLSADFRCHGRHGRGFFVEVDGPSHFCVRPFWRPRGRTLLKQRVFASQGWPLVSIPYWIAAPPGAYARRDVPGRPPHLEVNQEELKKLVEEQLDAWDCSADRQWWASEHLGKGRKESRKDPGQMH